MAGPQMVADLYILLMFLTAVAAFGRGGWEEQASITIKVIAATLSVRFANPAYVYATVSIRLIVIDFATLVGMMAVALKTRAFWPLWTAALQLLVFSAVFGPIVGGLWQPLAYATNEQLWSWPLLALIGVMAVSRGVGREARDSRH